MKPMELVDRMHEAMRAYAAVEDLLCVADGTCVGEPGNLSTLLRIVRERAEADVEKFRLSIPPLRSVA